MGKNDTERMRVLRELRVMEWVPLETLRTHLLGGPYPERRVKELRAKGHVVVSRLGRYGTEYSLVRDAGRCCPDCGATTGQVHVAQCLLAGLEVKNGHMTG